MLLRPKICRRQPQSGSILSSRHFISSRPVYFPIRPYSTPRPYESKTRVALSQPASVALNPPKTTHPPPLSLPEKLPDLPKYKYYFRIGKAYGAFYKNGLKAIIWTNYKLARALPDHIFSGDQARVHQAVRDGKLSRADFQLIRRTRRDLNKVPLFALIWLICGEFTPLVVIFFTGAVPRILWIPKQVQKAREEAEERRSKSRKESVVLVAGPSQRSDIESMPQEPQRTVLKSYAQSLGLYPAWWDRWIPTLIPTSLVRRRVYRRLEELEVDDFAIGRDGGAGKMAGEEVLMACEERGIDVLGKEDGHLRRDLQRWLDRRRTLATDSNADGKIEHSIGAGK